MAKRRKKRLGRIAAVQAGQVRVEYDNSTKVRKPSRLEALSTATAQDHSHLHSASIRATRSLKLFELAQVEERLNALQSAIANTKERKNQLTAEIVGLGEVLAKRC